MPAHSRIPLLPPARTILAVDLGTQSFRLTALDTAGRILWRWARPVASFVDGAVSEQDPAEWAAHLEAAFAEAGRAGLAPDGVAAAGPLAGWVPLGPDGAPLGRAVMYFDGRAAQDAARVGEALFDRPAAPRPTAADPLPQLLRLRRDAPAVLARAERLLDATGWLVHRLTGMAALDPYTAIRLYDGEVAGRLGADILRFGRPAALGERLGPLVPDLARHFPGPPAPVFAATFDSKCAYLASGIFDDGEALDISGTVTSFGVAARERVVDPHRRIYCVPLGARWLVRGSMGGTGSVLEWARATVLGPDLPAIEAAVAASPPGAGGVTFLPFHSGARAPLWTPHARGAFLGLSLDTGRPELARAVYEGLCFGLRHVLDTMAGLGVAVRDVRLAGGLARSDLLCAMKADVLGRPALKLADHELTTLGLAVIAGVALGVHASHAAAGRALAAVARRFEPSAGRALYEAPYRRYLAAVEALAPTFSPESVFERSGHRFA